MKSLTILHGSLPVEFVSTELALRRAVETGDQAPDFCAANLFLQAHKIVSITQESSLEGAGVLNAEGCYVLPGFVDIHVHGAQGHDVMDADAQGILQMARFFARHGVTSFVPTTMTASPQETMAAVVAVAHAIAIQQAQTTAEAHGARILGIHLEGPYISPEFPGAQPASHIRPPNVDEFERLVAAGPVRMITLAPEQPNAHALIHAAHQHRIIPVYGHTAATYEVCAAAIAAGVQQATHTYNAMTGLHHRHPGALGATLSHEQVYAQLIADNIHVHPAAMNILARCKGSAHTVLITDAMRAAGLPDGQYSLGGQEVFLKEGACRLADGTLAGSVLKMNQALQNFVLAAQQPLGKLWPTASRTPAQSIGLAHEIGSILPDHRADLVLLDQAFDVVATIIGGQIAYLRDPARWTPNDALSR